MVIKNEVIAGHFTALPYCGQAYEVWEGDAIQDGMQLSVISGGRIIKTVFGIDAIREFYRVTKQHSAAAAERYSQECMAMRGRAARNILKQMTTQIGTPSYLCR